MAVSLVGHERNRKMLSRFLGDEYSVRTTPPEDPLEIDLVLVDDRRFAEVQDEIEAILAAADPVFVPVLLLTAHPPERLRKSIWDTVDEIVSVPINKREFQMRLDSLAHRRRASVELKARQENSRERFKNLYEAVPDPILAVDADGTITEVNEPFERMVAMDREALLGAQLDDLEFEPRETVERLFLEVGDNQSSDGLVSVGDDEPPVITELNVNVLDSVGNLAERIGIFRDVTERESTREDLERQNERLDDFTRVVAHDLRNPLTIATGRVELAKETGDLSHLDLALEALTYMSELVEDLLEWSKKGDLVTDVSSVLIAEVASAAWQMTGVETTATLSVLADDRRIQADRDRLRQLLENLFRNALEHGEKGVAVTIEPLADGFVVADDGPGFESVESVFDPGFSSTDEGSGLGLATVERIAEAHGWTVEAGTSDRGGARIEFHGVETSEDATPE